MTTKTQINTTEYATNLQDVSRFENLTQTGIGTHPRFANAAKPFLPTFKSGYGYMKLASGGFAIAINYRAGGERFWAVAVVDKNGAGKWASEKSTAFKKLLASFPSAEIMAQFKERDAQKAAKKAKKSQKSQKSQPAEKKQKTQPAKATPATKKPAKKQQSASVKPSTNMTKVELVSTIMATVGEYTAQCDNKDELIALFLKIAELK